ncbi:MAG: leucine-rich repeat protein [Treponemataceae bacterium]
MKRNIKTQQGSLCLFFVSKVLPVIKDSFKTVITIFIIIFTLSFGTSCKQRMNIKEFIERELARDRSNTIVLYDTSATGYNDIVYVPSEKGITGTVNIKNEYNVGYTAVLTLDNPAQKNCFAGDEPPKVTLTEAGKFQFQFTFKKEADANGSKATGSADKKYGAAVPVTVKLTKHENGADTEFGEKRFTLRCNTPPAPCSVTATGDTFKITLPPEEIHKDIVSLNCAVTANGNPLSHNISVTSGDTSKTLTVKEIAKGKITPLKNANGERNIKVIAIDSVGLRTETPPVTGNYSYSSNTNLKVQTADTSDGVTNYGSEVTWMNAGGNFFKGVSKSHPYRLTDSKLKVKLSTLSDGATVSYNSTNYNLNDEIPISVDDADPNNQKNLDFTVTAEDESTVKNYTLTLGRQDGFKLSIIGQGANACAVNFKSGGNNKSSNQNVSDCKIYAADLVKGKLKVSIKSKDGAYLVTLIKASKTAEAASDPAKTENFYGGGSSKDIYGYSFELPMAQSQTITLGYDNSVSFNASGEATIPGEPIIKVRLNSDTGYFTMLPCDQSASYPANGIINFGRHPVLNMISSLPSGGSNVMFPDGSTPAYIVPQVKKIILPKMIGDIGSYTFRRATNLQEIIFPDGFEGDISTNFAFEDCTALEKVQINNSNRYFNDKYGNLIEKEKQGSSYTYDNCTVRLAVKNNPNLNDLQATLADGTIIPLQQTSGPDPFFAVYLANGSHNGNSYTIQQIANQACLPMFKYIVIDLPNLKEILPNNFNDWNYLTALFITVKTPANIDNNNYAIPIGMKNTGNVYVQNSDELDTYKNKWAKDTSYPTDKSGLYTANNFTIVGY